MQPSRPTLARVQRVLSGAAVTVLDRLPVPLPLARLAMLVENALENAHGGWGRLRDAGEADRYRAVRAAVERHAADGFVLDVGCSQGIVQEGLRYRRYVGVDRYAPALRRARGAGAPETTFVVGDAGRYVPDTAPDAVVLNEVLYYLPRPVRVVERYAALLAPDGVVVVSCYARTWTTRRLLRRLRRRLTLVSSERVVAGPHAWEVAVLVPRR
ncbi:class I SAM-dependent methyltransferase [Friedmanniella luteola]|uniref:class I SAM-dependent methyltransferase n=1 Tax=Friedmanniella luteola TaxID=546871 RepID=UPI0012FD775C|nr:methyltransferase domain-containing protein [Friedmanniella luteola]